MVQLKTPFWTFQIATLVYKPNQSLTNPLVKDLHYHLSHEILIENQPPQEKNINLKKNGINWKVTIVSNCSTSTNRA